MSLSILMHSCSIKCINFFISKKFLLTSNPLHCNVHRCSFQLNCGKSWHIISKVIFMYVFIGGHSHIHWQHTEICLTPIKNLHAESNEHWSCHTEQKYFVQMWKITLSFQNLDPESYSVAVITTENVQDELQTGSEKYMNLFSEGRDMLV